MTRNNMSEWVRAVSLAAALILVPFAATASAQNNNVNSARTETRAVDRDDDRDWGWLGLIGLAGLLGLLPKKRRDVVVDDRDDRGGRV
jgi:hypothetical protein